MQHAACSMHIPLQAAACKLHAVAEGDSFRFPVESPRPCTRSVTMTGSKTPPWMKPVYLLLGMSGLVAEIVGIVLPLIPTTGPLILAAFAFSPSSDRMRDRLMNHPLSVASAPISRPAAGSPQVEDRRGRRHDRGLHLLHRVGHRTDGSPGAHGGDRSQGDLVRPPPADGSGGLEVCRPMAPTYLVTIGHLAQPDEGAVESASRRRQRRGGRGPERCGDDWYHRPLGTL